LDEDLFASLSLLSDGVRDQGLDIRDLRVCLLEDSKQEAEKRERGRDTYRSRVRYPGECWYLLKGSRPGSVQSVALAGKVGNGLIKFLGISFIDERFPRFVRVGSGLRHRKREVWHDRQKRCQLLEMHDGISAVV
jgi:hypothetical protein